MRKKYWYGKEIEGRFTGLETLFISLDFEEFEKVQTRFSHILIGTTLIDQLYEAERLKNQDFNVKTTITWERIEELIDNEFKYFTIEAKPEQIKKLPKAILLKCHILLWLDVSELGELKSTDSVKLCPQSHDMYCFTLHNGQRVTRDAYFHDRHDN